MNLHIKLLSICAVLLLAGCNARVSTHITKAYPETDVKQEIKMVKTDDLLPENTEVIGKVKVGDKGATATSKCTYPKVIEIAKEEARKAGGNAIRITQHKIPDYHCTCHRIKADILRIENVDSYLFGMPLKKTENIEISDSNYTVLNIYRPNEIGLNPAYNLHLGDVILCRVQRDYKKTVLIKTDSASTLWVKTESKEEIPVDFKPGQVYYLHCGSTAGALVPRPNLSLMGNGRNKEEFLSFNPKNYDATVDTFEITKKGKSISYGRASSTANGDSSSSKHINGQNLKEPKKMVIAINVGYSRRLGLTSKDVLPQFVEHMENVKNGYNVGLDFTGFPSEVVGAGAKLAVFCASRMRTINYIDENNTPATHDVNDTYTIPLVGPMLTTRIHPGDMNKVILADFSMGYMGYTERGGDAYSSYKCKGGTMYLSFDLGFDYWFDHNGAIGCKLSIIAGSLSKYTIKKDGRNEVYKFEKDNREDLSRIDFSIGIRFGK